MYLPKHLEETQVEVLHGLIHAHPLGTLVTLTAGGLDANHTPFEVDAGPTPFGTLRGHVARANPVWREVSREVEALVIFQGPGIYVSPAWYPTEQETGRVVPTWNYAVVHAHGQLRVIDDKAWLRDFVTKLTIISMRKATRRERETRINAVLKAYKELASKTKAGALRASPDRPARRRGLGELARTR